MKLSKLRKGKQITQSDLAKKLGLERSTISKWENKESFPKIDTILTLAEIFDCSPEEIIKSLRD